VVDLVVGMVDLDMVGTAVDLVVMELVLASLYVVTSGLVMYPQLLSFLVRMYGGMIGHSP
jgi:hypothetical protein